MSGKRRIKALPAPEQRVSRRITPGNDMELMMKAGQEAVVSQFETTMKSAADQIEKCTCFGKGNVEAITQCSTIVAKGFEEVAKNMAEWMHNVMEQNVATGRQMLAVKTLRELVDLQTGYMRSWMDNSMAETTKLSEISARVTNQAIAPISARVNEFVETIASNQNKAA